MSEGSRRFEIIEGVDDSAEARVRRPRVTGGGLRVGVPGESLNGSQISAGIIGGGERSVTELMNPDLADPGHERDLLCPIPNCRRIHMSPPPRTGEQVDESGDSVPELIREETMNRQGRLRPSFRSGKLPPASKRQVACGST